MGQPNIWHTMGPLEAYHGTLEHLNENACVIGGQGHHDGTGRRRLFQLLVHIN